ncbi:TPA: hypothetical protein ACVGI0_006074 [Pseudomonas aeruginosa]
MKDPLAGKYRKFYMREFQQAEKVMKGRGGRLEWSQHDYQAFTYFEPGVSLVSYPHKTTAGNRHLRVRDQGSKNKTLAAQLMVALDSRAGHTCTFSSKG